MAFRGNADDGIEDPQGPGARLGSVASELQLQLPHFGASHDIREHGPARVRGGRVELELLLFGQIRQAAVQRLLGRVGPQHRRWHQQLGVGDRRRLRQRQQAQAAGAPIPLARRPPPRGAPLLRSSAPQRSVLAHELEGLAVGAHLLVAQLTHALDQGLGLAVVDGEQRVQQGLAIAVEQHLLLGEEAAQASFLGELEQLLDQLDVVPLVRASQRLEDRGPFVGRQVLEGAGAHSLRQVGSDFTQRGALDQLQHAGADLGLHVLEQGEHPPSVGGLVELHQLAACLQAGGAVGALERSPQQQRALGLVERRGDGAHRLGRLGGVVAPQPGPPGDLLVFHRRALERQQQLPSRRPQLGVVQRLLQLFAGAQAIAEHELPHPCELLWGRAFQMVEPTQHVARGRHGGQGAFEDQRQLPGQQLGALQHALR